MGDWGSVPRRPEGPTSAGEEGEFEQAGPMEGSTLQVRPGPGRRREAVWWRREAARMDAKPFPLHFLGTSGEPPQH